MERKQIRFLLEEEEEEEEDRNRRSSLRKRKRARYFEDDDEEEQEEEEDSDKGDEEEDNKESSEQPGPSTQYTHNQRMQENRLLTVTCGNKTGILDVEKLNRGEECIKCQNSWFSPPTFEEFGGKGCSKKWKTSIFYGNKPLQFLFEQGSLTTPGFKKRGTPPTKQKKTRSSNRISESSSEESQIQSAEETEEDDVRDEDWIPGSEELILEAEEERVGVENGGEVIDSGADKSEEEEDKKQQGEMDEDMPAVDDNSVCEEREPKLIHSTPEKRALEKEVKVIIKRLPEFQVQTACQLICVEWDTLKDSSYDENAQNKEDREHNCSAIDDPSVSAGTHIDPSEMSGIIVGGSEKENGEEFVQSDERKEDEQREIKTETGNFPTPLYAPATSSPDIKPETENMGATSNHWEEREETECCGNTLEENQSREVGPELQIQWIQGFEDCENANNNHLYMSTSEASGQSSPIQRGGSAPTESQSVLVDWTTSGYEAAESQAMKLETRVPQTSRASDISQSSDMAEAASSRPSDSCVLDTMDLDQLRREKIKLQIKVLKLQEEYYTQKIRECKE